MKKSKKINQQNNVDNVLFEENKYNVVPLKKDNTSVNNRNFIENIELPNADIRTWNELSPEEQQKLIEVVPKPTIDNYRGIDIRKAIAAKRYNNAKGYATFESRTGEQILKDRDNYQIYQILKYFNEQNINNKINNKKCGGMKRVPRKKAFFGAIIGAITNSILAKNQYEDEQKRYEEQMALQKEQIKKNEMYNKLNSDIQSQLALQQNNDIYDNLRNFKCGGKIKRKRGAYGLYSSYTPFNIAPLGTEQIKLNVPQTSNIYNGNNSINDFGMASGALGTVINSAASIGNYLENNLLTDQKQQHQNTLSKLENDAKTRNTGSTLNVNNINNARNLVANNLNNSTYNTYNTQMNELQKRRRGQLNSLYLS